MKFQLLNGTFYPAEENLIHASNRGFNYGDGFFESIRVSNGNAPFIELHWERLTKACQILCISIPESLTLRTFSNQILMLARRNEEPNSRIRFQGFRVGGGRYAPKSSTLCWSISSLQLDSSSYVLNKYGLKVGIFENHSINPAPQSTFKSSNSLPYILGAIHAQENGWHDCFLLDADGFLAEATGSNIFLVQDGFLITPDLSNGGVAGVMRNVVLSSAKAIGLKPSSTLIKVEDVLSADECFLTNATRGIQWVGAFEKKRFFKRKCEQLTTHINHKYGLSS